MLRLYVAGSNIKYSVVESLRRLRGDDSGVTAIEYGLIAGAIAVAIIATVIGLGKNVTNLFTSAQSGLSSAASSTL